MHRLRRATLALIVALSAGATAAACSVDGLAFRRDDRLQIENLPDRSEIEVPFELELSFDGTLADPADPAAAGDAVAFAVLVDRTPPPPGRSLESLLADDPVCAGPQGCPDGYLERNRIHVTTALRHPLDDVPVGTDSQERRGFHEVTVVLVDAEGRRVGETAAFARFRVPGRDR